MSEFVPGRAVAQKWWEVGSLSRVKGGAVANSSGSEGGGESGGK